MTSIQPTQRTIHIGGIPVPEPLLDAIHKAQRTRGYKFCLLTKEINGLPRLAILMGEAHRKNALADDAGRNLLLQCPLRGCEGYDPSKLWWRGRFDSLASLLMSPTFRILSRFRKHGSTLHVAQRGTAELDQLRESITTVLRTLEMGDRDGALARMDQLQEHAVALRTFETIPLEQQT